MQFKFQPKKLNPAEVINILVNQDGGAPFDFQNFAFLIIIIRT